MNQSVYGETIEINRETSIPVTGILTTRTEDEANEPSENNEEENTLTDQETIIKDNEIHHLPQTSELSQLHWILIGIASISVVLYLFNKKKR